MKIKILGTRAHIKLEKPGHTNFSGVLVDDLILMDLGEKKFLNYDPQLILITHFHPDHAFFMEENITLDLTIPVFAPEKNLLLPHAKIITDTVIWNDYIITPIPTIHSIAAKSQGYIIKKENKRFLYTSDTAWIEKEVQKKLGKLDLVITEASYINNGGRIFKNKNGEIYGHTGIPNLINIFKHHTKRIVFVHLGSWFMRDVETGTKKIKALEETNINLDVAHDGKEYEI